MRSIRASFVVLVVFALATCALTADAAQRRSRRAPVRRYDTITVPVNQYFRLRMEDTLSSKTSRVGDRFQATVVTPVYTRGREAVPAGSMVSGRVTYVRRAESKGKSGAIGVRFDRLRLPDGTTSPITGSLTELEDEHSGDMTEEGVLKGRSSKRRNVYFIGGGAAGGALLGGLIGGGKGAGIGAAVGAGAGIAGALLKKGHEAEVKRGTEVGMALDRSAYIRRGR